jgi:hydrogenase-4 component B
MKHAQSRLPVLPYITWECGFGELGPRAQVAATSFVQPIASMFHVILQYSQSLELEGAHRRLFPDELTAHANTEPVLETRVYAPAARWLLRVGDQLNRLQAGSIHVYLLTMVITLLILLAIGGSMK